MAVLRDVLRQHLRRVGPSVLVVEDLHWADGSTLEGLASLHKALDDGPLMALHLTRPRPDDTRGPSLRHETVAMAPLSASQSRELVQGVAQGTSLAAGLDRALLLQCEGVPLYLEEMTRALVGSGELRGRLQSREPRAGATDTGMPLSVESAIRARFERLEEARDTLHLAAVIGPTVPEDLMLAASDLDPAAARARFQACVEAGMLEAGEPHPPSRRFTFKHHLVWRAAYEEVPRQLRPALHRRVADALQRDFRASIDAHPDLIARQLSGAGDLAAAIPFWLSAGQRSVANAAVDEAIASYEFALDGLQRLAPTDDILRQELMARFALAPLYTARHWTAEVIETTADRILVLCRRLPDRAAEIGAHLFRWGVQYSSGRVAQSLVTARHAMALAEPADAQPSLKAASRHVESMSLFAGGRIVEALDSATATLEASTPGVEDFMTGHYQLSPIGASLAIRGCCLHALSRFAEAEHAWCQAHETIARLAPRPVVRAYAMGVLLTFRMVSGSLGDWIDRDRPGLVRMLDALQALCHDEGLGMWLAFSRLIRLACETHGSTDGSRAQEAAQCIRLLNDSGVRLWFPQFASLQARLLDAAGEREAARAVLDEAREEAVRNGQRLGDREIGRLWAGMAAGGA